MFRDFRAKSRYRMPVTPMSGAEFSRLRASGAPAAECAVKAWRDAGNNAEWHRLMQDEVRRAMPLVAYFLDVEAYGHPQFQSRTEI